MMNITMTSKERIKNAIARRRNPAGLALDFRGTGKVYENLKKFLNVDSDEAVRKRLHSDIRFLYKSYGEYIGPKEKINDTSYINYWGIGHTLSVDAFGGGYWVPDRHPLKEFRGINEICDNYKWPEAGWWDYDTKAALQNVAPDEYWISIFGSSILGRSCELRGMEQAFVDMAEENEVISFVLDKVTDFFIEQTSRAIAAYRGKINMVESMDDYGNQNGMMISPAMWRKYVKPRLKRFIDGIKKHGVVIFHHTCGSIYPIIDDLVEIGVDVLNPLQFSAAGMEPQKIINEFGEKISFHGGIDIQQVLPRCGLESIIKHAQAVISVMNKHNGYIMAGTHYFQPDISPEKIVKLFDFAHEMK